MGGYRVKYSLFPGLEFTTGTTPDVRCTECHMELLNRISSYRTDDLAAALRHKPDCWVPLAIATAHKE